MKRTSLSLFVLLLTTLLYAADFWTNKPYDKWSVQECHTMLRNSPWSKTYNIEKTVMRQVNRSLGEMRSESDEGNLNPSITYYVSFRSSTPVRQAAARQARIDAKYDKMDDAHKQALDAQLKRFLEVSFPDKIIVQVTYGSNVADWDRQLAFYWQSQTVETLKGTIYLSGPDGERIEPIEYFAGTGARRELQFAFPRNPQLAAENPTKPLAFEFQHPNIDEGSSNFQSTQSTSSGGALPAGQVDASTLPGQTATRGNPSAPAKARSTTRIYVKFDTPDMKYQGAINY